MLPVERPSILNDRAHEMRGHTIADHDGSILKLLNEETVMKIAESAWAKNLVPLHDFWYNKRRGHWILAYYSCIKGFSGHYCQRIHPTCCLWLELPPFGVSRELCSSLPTLLRATRPHTLSDIFKNLSA